MYSNIKDDHSIKILLNFFLKNNISEVQPLTSKCGYFPPKPHALRVIGCYETVQHKHTLRLIFNCAVNDAAHREQSFLFHGNFLTLLHAI